MAENIQPSFSSGEIAPEAQGRIDLARYQTALKTCRNFLTRVYGGVVNRPGTEFIAESETGRFIPFVFSEDQSYVLDFLNGRMRVIRDGGYVLEANQVLTPNAAHPPVFTVTGHGYSTGDQVFISGTNMPEINNQFWFVTVTGLDTFTLIGLTSLGVVGVGTVARIYHTTTPYVLSVLPKLTFTQLRDVMTLAVTSVRPQDLSRFDHDDWNFDDMVFEEGPFQDVNVDSTLNMGVDGLTGSITINTDFAAFTSDNVGQLIYIEQLNYGVPWEVALPITAGDIRRSEGKYYVANSDGTTGTLRPNGEVLGITENDGGVVWEYIHSGYGIALITAVNLPTQALADVKVRMADDLMTFPSYKWAFGAWGGDQGWPAAVTYFQQRKTLASTPVKPEFIWFSGTNSFDFFGRSTPIVDDDSVEMQLVGNQLNAVRYMLQLGKLILLTVGGKWVIPDDDNNPTITPTRKSARQQGALGTAQVTPVIVEDSILYVVNKDQTVQDLSYQFVSNAYSGKDLSVLSKHLLEGHTIIAAAYQHVPFQIDWLVRDDGVLIGCTYLKEHEVWGWHRHDTINGLIKDVCVISEGREDSVYIKVLRTINGQSKYYTEKLASRLYTDIKDANFLDSSVKYDGRNTSPVTMTIIVPPGSFGAGFGEGGYGSGGFGGSGSISNIYQVDVSYPYFTIFHVGDTLFFYSALEDRTLRLLIVEFISATSVIIDAAGIIFPLDLRNTETLAWVHAKSTFRGLNHLEGQTVSILADGKVHPRVVVEDGEIDLQYAAGVILVGLPIEADFETLNLNLPVQGSILDREKCVFAVRLMVDSTRGIFAGPNEDNLDEYVQREAEDYEEPVSLKTGLASIRIASTWEPGGRFLVRQSDPLPVSIIGVLPDLDVGGIK